VQNVSKYPVLENAIVRAAVIISPRLPDSLQENQLFMHRYEWQTSGGVVPVALSPGAIYRLHVDTVYNNPLEDGKQIESGQKVVYVVTEARDYLGAMPVSQSCWYIAAPQWDRFQLCYGHNGIGAPVSPPPS
jgi:hypothetical protein